MLHRPSFQIDLAVPHAILSKKPWFLIVKLVKICSFSRNGKWELVVMRWCSLKNHLGGKMLETNLNMQP